MESIAVLPDSERGVLWSKAKILTMALLTLKDGDESRALAPDGLLKCRQVNKVMQPGVRYTTVHCKTLYGL